MSLSQQGVYRFEEFELDAGRRALRRDGEPVVLSPKAFDVLTYLVLNPARVVTKEELLKAVWAESFVEEGNLAQHISSVRKALGDRAGYIVTVPGRGYQFTAKVQTPAAVEEFSPLHDGDIVVQRVRERTRVVVEETTTEPEAQLARLPSRGRSRLRLAIYAMLLAELLAVAIWLGWHRRASAGGYRQVVVADFINSTGDAAFDRTLKRAIEIDLAQSPYMDVLGERRAVDTLLLMGRKSDTALTAEIAREICERTNYEVLLAGSITAVGQRYLLTLEASDCKSGRTLASAKAEATTKEDVLDALDRVAERVRRGLNESAKSVASYEVPLREATTPSLDALEAYSTGMDLQARGVSRSEMIAAFQRAVDLDPQFAMAYRQLGMENLYVGQTNVSAQYFARAFELSEHVSAREQLDLRASYYAHGQRNLLEGIKAYELWASGYPQDPIPVIDVVDAYMTLGQYGPAIAAGERGLKLYPDAALLYENLASCYRQVNRFEDAKAMTEKAAKVGKGDTGLHLSLIEIALAERDQSTVDRETQWFEAHEDGSTVWYYPSFRGDAAAAAGRYRHAEELFQNAYRSAERAGLPEAASGILADEALAEFKLGLPEASRATLSHLQRPYSDSADVAVLEAELGDVSYAERFLAAHATASPDTLMTYVDLPRVRAALALARHKPLEAIAALEPARPYEMRDYGVATLRGEADLQAGQAEQAIEEYKKILANPGIDPTSVLYPLARLELARAYGRAGDRGASAAEYKEFLARWKDSDAEIPLLQEAKAEYAKVQ